MSAENRAAWSVHIQGMDDVLPAVDRLDAVTRAAAVNAQFLTSEQVIAMHGSGDANFRPVAWAVPQSGSPYDQMTAEQVDATWKEWLS